MAEPQTVAEVIEQALAQGDMEVAGYTHDGEPRYRLTPKGTLRLEEEERWRGTQ